MDPKIFKAYDIRGVYPDQLNEEDVYKIAKGFFTFVVQKLNLSKPPKIVLSYDGRLSSPQLAEQARKALIESGAEVIDIGLSGTPTFYFAVSHHDYDAGIQISASHNPKEYNGVKSVVKVGGSITKIGNTTGLDEIKEIIQAEKFTSLGKAGHVTKKEGVLQDQVNNALKITKKPSISKLKVVADAANGTGALYLDALFRKLPCELVKMNFEIDGNFPSHHPDPSQFSTLVDLQRRVVSEKADLGIAPDGDSDRIFFIDEKGSVVPASLITSFIAREILKNHPGEKIGFDVRNTFNVLHAVKENGGIPVVGRIGNIFSTEIMKKENCVFFGENSGHYFFKNTYFAEDPIPVILIILSAISREKQPISEILKPLSVGFQSGGMRFKTKNMEKIMGMLQDKYKEGKTSFTDGLSVDFPDWRFNIRPSNTEPLVRLNVEALRKDLMEEKRDEIENIIKEFSN
jgi:phosphomannomutase